MDQTPEQDEKTRLLQLQALELDKKYLDEIDNETLAKEMAEITPHIKRFALDFMLIEEKLGKKPNPKMKKHPLKKEHPNIDFTTPVWQKWVSVCVQCIQIDFDSILVAD